ncbi:MAG TPA: M15 family metallopeptidase [Bacteroidales bacterium]|nr:M15 family metallopeptidase [Bacteroidales bacterium]
MNKNFKLIIILLLLLLIIPKIQNITASHIQKNTKESIDSDTTDKKYLIGKFNPTQDTNFILVNHNYSNKNVFIRKPVWEAYKKMADDAAKEGIKLVILSGTRTFERQKEIWESKWTGNKKVNGKNLSIEILDPVEKAITILKYTAMPGTSRHHWGTDVDLNSLNPSYFKSGYGKKILEWLEKNAYKYGFCQPYTEKNNQRPLGHEEECWHWSYIPLSSKYLNLYIKYINNEDIKGFKGDETVMKINIIDNYMKTINKSCYEN